MNYSFFNSPLGKLLLISDVESLVGLYFENMSPKIEGFYKKEDSVIKLAKKELELYFNKKLETFSIPIKLNGTDFQNRVWKELLNIPYSNTATYGEIAEKLKSGPRAVASAIAKNKILIIIPCHRVVRKDKTPSGYAGGIENKEFLLNLEISTKW